ncbi:hypothetical protein VQL36_13185 [Chengkuizengella sp. SCS-71B]|uniref:hypothetical protein n=1 Tax=Chengkuizengella sp. SCS-71B TaxID=3115290 RepID=UPI0032C222A1
MQQLINIPDTRVFTISAEQVGTINSVENFLATINVGGVIRCFPICNVTAVGNNILGKKTQLKPVRKDMKGECSCCEDPATNELATLLNKTVEINYLTRPGSPLSRLIGTVAKAGEGIVILTDVTNPFGADVSNTAISTCQINFIEIKS